MTESVWQDEAALARATLGAIDAQDLESLAALLDESLASAS